MNINYTIEQIIPQNCNDEDWKNYFKLRVQLEKEVGALQPFNSWEQIKERNTKSFKKKELGVFLLLENKQAVGYFNLIILQKDDKENRLLAFNNHLLSGNLKNYFSLIVEAAIKFDPAFNYLVIKSDDEKNEFVTNEIEVAHKEELHTLELFVENAKTDVINKWIEESESKFKNYTIKFYEVIPEEHIEEYTNVFVELLNDVPVNWGPRKFSDIKTDHIRERQENGIKHNYCSCRYLIFNEEGKQIGQTNVFVNKNKPERMGQYMTGVVKKYRGVGLAKWMKARMYLKLIEKFPQLEKIDTETHLENYASKGISEKMGYTQTGSEKHFFITKETIIEYLKKNGI